MSDKEIKIQEATRKIIEEHREQFGGSLTDTLSTLVAEGRKSLLTPPARYREPLAKPGVRTPAPAPPRGCGCDGPDGPGSHHRVGCAAREAS